MLRQIWLNDPFADVAKLNLDLLERWKLNKLKTHEDPTKYEQHVLETITALFSSSERPALTADDLAFLDIDLGAVGLAARRSELTARLITVSLALGVLSEDVAKHADQVRNFRNYIHRL
jgi:GAF domain-containing protein